MIVVVIIGLIAAMAVPVFLKVRQNSQENVIYNNLRQVAYAGNQYLLENSSVITVTGSTLISRGYMNAIDSVAGEADYGTQQMFVDGGTLSVTTSSGGTIKFTY